MSGVLARVRLSSHNFLSVYAFIRNASTAHTSDIDPEYESAKPFKKIPGPKPLPIPKFGNFWRFLPFGSFGHLNTFELYIELFKNYGPIVRLTGTGRYDLILVSEPNDAQKVFRAQGENPIRIGVESLDYYRRYVRTDVFKDFQGVVTTQGEEWQKNRIILNQPLLKPQNILKYHEPTQIIARDFIERMRSMRGENHKLPKMFHHELNKWALESVAHIALDTRLGCLDPNLPADSDANKMISGVLDLFDLLYKLDVLPSLWQIYSTSNYKKLIKTMDIMVGIALNHVTRKMDEIEARPMDDPNGWSILETILNSENGKSVAMTVAMDLLMAGIDTTSNTAALVMYHLATHPAAQEKLYQELKEIMPHKNDPLPVNYLTETPFLKACQKESQRLLPITVGNMRQVSKNIVLQGYQIPKGTNLLMSHMVMCLKDENFTKPKEFIPERWLRNSNGECAPARKASPFAFLPFGFGVRMCLGRRVAELQLHTILAMVFRNFKLSFPPGPLKIKSTLLLRPMTPLDFKIEERQD